MADNVLERILAEAECSRVLNAYGRAVDWQDRDGLAALLWPDAVIDLGFFKGNAEEAIAFLMANAARSERRFHAISNVLLQIRGEIALSDSCCITHAITDDGAGGSGWQLFLGRYLDRLERRDGEWRIAERVFVLNGYHAGANDEPPFLADVHRAEHFTPDHKLFRFR